MLAVELTPTASAVNVLAVKFTPGAYVCERVSTVTFCPGWHYSHSLSLRVYFHIQHLSQHTRSKNDCSLTPGRLLMLASRKLKSYLLAVELTLVLLLERLFMMLSPQLTTPPLLVMLNVRNLYRSSPHRGLYGFSGRLQTLGLMWSGTVCNRKGTHGC